MEKDFKHKAIEQLQVEKQKMMSKEKERREAKLGFDKVEESPLPLLPPFF